jgi:hypothetical protein
MKYRNPNGRHDQQNSISSAEFAFRLSSSRTTVYFEVAPDPSDQPLASEWRGLPMHCKNQATDLLSRNVVPVALDLLEVEGVLLQGTGGYLGETNPSLAIEVAFPDEALRVAKLMGHVFAQASVMVISEAERDGLDPTDVISISLPREFTAIDVAGLYDQLWCIERDGTRLISGHTTTRDQMGILNFSDVETADLKEIIDQTLRGRYVTSISQRYAAFVEKSDYGYKVGTEGLSAFGEVRDLWFSNYLRLRARRMVWDSIEERGVSCPLGDTASAKGLAA